MKLAPVLLLLLGACQGAETFADGGTSGDDDDRAWTGTAGITVVDFSGNTDTITVEATWAPTAHDEDGADYAATGTVTIARTVPGCTVMFDPASHAIGAEDGYLRVDHDGTYRGFAGTFWDATITMECPPNEPSVLASTVAQQWWNAATPRPLTGPDEIAGDETMGAFHYTWQFTRDGRDR